MQARHRETGEIFDLAEEGIIARDGRHFCWYQVDLLPEPADEQRPLSVSERIRENFIELGKAVSKCGVKISDIVNTSYEDCRVQEPPAPIGYLGHEETCTRIQVYKRIGWFRRFMLRWWFGLRYEKEKSDKN